MLVLSRKSSQQIMIGPDIQITIVKIDRNQVRIGIQAPADIPILRQELAGVPKAGPSAPIPTRPAGPVPVRNRRVQGLDD
jgi:carbon storage regulator